MLECVESASASSTSMRSRRSRDGLGQAQRASAKGSGRCSNRCSVVCHGQRMGRVVQCSAGRKRCVRESRVPTRGERRPGRSDLRERQCGDAERSGGANEAGEGAICSAERRWCGGAEVHKDDQGGVGEASYQTAGAVVVDGAGDGREGRVVVEVVRGAVARPISWRLGRERDSRRLERGRSAVGIRKLKQPAVSQGSSDNLESINQHLNLRRAPSVTTHTV